VENRDAIDAAIEGALKQDKADAWIAKLQAVGVPCGKINTVAQAFDDPHTSARRMIETTEHPTIGALKVIGTPFKFSGTECSVRSAPPTLGQHSDEILAQELGLDANAIAELRREKVV
jgi:crotonobetainyl-CoA:carnitine CoA-transferase CaiB-like acyl-CoA transferase